MAAKKKESAPEQAPHGDLQAASASDEGAQEKAAKHTLRSPIPKGMARITVTSTAQSPVTLSVNGKRFTLPVGKPVPVPEWAIPSLEAAGITFTKE